MCTVLGRVRQLAGHAPAVLDGVAAIGKNWVSEVAGLRHGLAEGSIDEWNPDYVRRAMAVMGPLFRFYFRGEVRGLEKIPPQGPVLIVGNHSGGLMIADTFVFTMAFYDHFGVERRFHQLAHDIAVKFPGAGIRPFGTVKASRENALAAFEKGAAVLVYPGGDYETFRPTWHSDQIEFGGRQGFVRLALEAGVPIVSLVAIGGQESGLFVTRGERVSRALGLDKRARLKVMPLTLGPPFGVNILDFPIRIPIPAKITIEVLDPVDLEQRFGPEPDPDEVYDELTSDMQSALDSLSEERTLPVVG
jgi:1-acyl-sn-glycerol-3-phosphate acyltransferase